MSNNAIITNDSCNCLDLDISLSEFLFNTRLRQIDDFVSLSSKFLVLMATFLWPNRMTFIFLSGFVLAVCVMNNVSDVNHSNLMMTKTL